MNIFKFEMKNHTSKTLLNLVHPHYEEGTVFVNILNGVESNKKTLSNIEIKLTKKQFVEFCAQWASIGQQFQMVDVLHSCKNCNRGK